ncbi:MAG: YihY/virulence factor BrkB family protein [Bacteroidota bacterium]
MANRFAYWLRHNKVIENLVLFLKNIRFRGGKISLYFILKTFIQKLGKDELLERANAVAFSFTVAMFPAMLFLFTLIPYIHNFIPSVDNESIMTFIGQIMPPNMYSVVESTVYDIVSHSRGDLLTFGFILSLFLATNGTMSLLAAFNSRYKMSHKRSYLKTRLVATWLTFVLAIVVIAAIILLVIGEFAVIYVIEHSPIDIDALTIYGLLFIRFLVLFVVFWVAISSLFYFGPEVHSNWSFFSYGSFTATIFSLIASYTFSAYIAQFGTYNKLYGSIGVMIALMIWIMILSIILLVCYELNAAIHHATQLTKDKRNHPMLEQH